MKFVCFSFIPGNDILLFARQLQFDEIDKNNNHNNDVLETILKHF